MEWCTYSTQISMKANKLFELYRLVGTKLTAATKNLEHILGLVFFLTFFSSWNLILSPSQPYLPLPSILQDFFFHIHLIADLRKKKKSYAVKLISDLNWACFLYFHLVIFQEKYFKLNCQCQTMPVVGSWSLAQVKILAMLGLFCSSGDKISWTCQYWRCTENKNLHLSL